MPSSSPYAVIVIGGGHAGAEAAWAAANMLRPEYDDSAGRRGRVALVTMDPAKIGVMSCNPAIGGLAKGQIVREIDAMGGLMPLAADATGIQFRVLNASKGPAVRGPRCQSDKYRYARHVQHLLHTRPNLDILPGRVESFLIEQNRCRGIIYIPTLHPTLHPTTTTTTACRHDKPITTHPRNSRPLTLHAHAVVLSTGTFMRGLMHTGDSQTPGGRVGEGPAVGISKTLKDLGFELARLKTGTPPRLAAETLDLAALETQNGDARPLPFSDMTGCGAREEAYHAIAERFPVIDQRPCWITCTNAAIHSHIRDNLHRAPIYNGRIQTVGPRYCPSIEDKIVRFADRTAHHVFLEPESLDTNEIYCNGISTSLPRDVQDFIVRHLPGCERAAILRYGYAVEYDMVPARQIDATAMTKRLPGLFFAGQINGTTGYEEAAGQGLVAGVNAVRYLRRQPPLRLRRDQAYIGVMMDDLVTKAPREPYRMFTSRAEFRLLLRADNTGRRLTPLARELGLIDDTRWRIFQQRQAAAQDLAAYAAAHKIAGQPMRQWMAKPHVSPVQVLAELNGDPLPAPAREQPLVATLLADIQYAGYIDRQQKEIDRLAAEEHTLLPAELDFSHVRGLRREAVDTLSRFKPATLGQARRLAGVNPADLMLISIAINRRGNKAETTDEHPSMK